MRPYLGGEGTQQLEEGRGGECKGSAPSCALQ